MKITVILADDHKLLRDGLRSLLDTSANIAVVGEASDGLQAVELAAKSKPDIVLMDITMPGLNGIEAARKIIAARPQTRTIMLSMHSDRRFITETLKAGATGYVLKDSAFSEVVEAIHTVMAGDIYLSEQIRKTVITDYINLVKESRGNVFSDLSGREREVLQLLAEGKSTKEIASMLSVSVKTIETHRKQIMDKLHIRSIAELTKYAIREGLTPLD